MKYVLSAIIVCSLLSLLLAFIQVNLFESNSSKAIYNECVQWDYSCIDDCQDQHNQGLSCSSCCLQTGVKVKPIKERLSEVIKLNLIIGVSLGFAIGLVIYDRKRR